MQKFVFAVSALLAFAFIGPAASITQETGTTVTRSGPEILGAPALQKASEFSSKKKKKKLKKPKVEVLPAEVVGDLARGDGTSRQRRPLLADPDPQVMLNLYKSRFNHGLGGGGESSDIRLKTDIVWLGTRPDGISLHRYRYLWSGTEYVGVIAQEVTATRPDAVLRGADGFLRVDYGKLGTRLITFDEWTRQNTASAGAD